MPDTNSTLPPNDRAAVRCCDYCQDSDAFLIPGGVYACESCFYYVLDDDNYPN